MPCLLGGSTYYVIIGYFTGVIWDHYYIHYHYFSIRHIISELFASDLDLRSPVYGLTMKKLICTAVNCYKSWHSPPKKSKFINNN